MSGLVSQTTSSDNVTVCGHPGCRFSAKYQKALKVVQIRLCSYFWVLLLACGRRLRSLILRTFAIKKWIYFPSFVTALAEAARGKRTSACLLKCLPSDCSGCMFDNPEAIQTEAGGEKDEKRREGKKEAQRSESRWRRRRRSRQMCGLS